MYMFYILDLKQTPALVPCSFEETNNENNAVLFQLFYFKTFRVALLELVPYPGGDNR